MGAIYHRHMIMTDASMTGWGAVFEGRAMPSSIHLIFPHRSKPFSVNVRDFQFISRCREIEFTAKNKK